ncbi:hypothetical protein Tco_0252564 [Tanacetum coccineum]
MGSMLIANGDDYLDGCVGVRGREVNGGEVVLGVVKSCLRENPDGATGVVGGDSRGVKGGAFGSMIWRFGVNSLNVKLYDLGVGNRLINVSLTFSEAGVFHVNWTSLEQLRCSAGGHFM